MAATSKQRAKSKKARPFTWFCRLSHKRNSKGFDRSNGAAATSSHDQTTENSWANDRVGIKRERFSADDDQWCGGDVSISDLLKMVRRLHKGRSFRTIQLSIHRLWRRTETNFGANSGFRRVGRTDE